MQAVNMHEAKSTLSRLVAAIETGEENEIIIARDGHPAARLVPVIPSPKIRFGVAAGKFTVPDDIDGQNAEIEELFYGKSA
jgi:antitoxin (DNA-binding transcriptional repressor) of toxin-antitoxin stability system